jgi:hypothetical protein
MEGGPVIGMVSFFFEEEKKTKNKINV